MKRQQLYQIYCIGFFFLSEYEIKKYSEKESSAKLKSEIQGFREIKNAFLQKRSALAAKVRREYSNDIELLLAAGDVKTAKKLKKKAMKSGNETSVEYVSTEAPHSRMTSSEPERSESNVSKSDFKTPVRSAYHSDDSEMRYPEYHDTKSSTSDSYDSVQTYPPVRITGQSSKTVVNRSKSSSGKSLSVIIAGAVVIALAAVCVPHISDYMESKAEDESDDNIKYSISAVMESVKDNTSYVNEENQGSYNNSDSKKYEAYEPEEYITHKEDEQKGEMVWITDTGECYHSIPNCGKSRTSTLIPLEQAVKEYKRCSKCW